MGLRRGFSAVKRAKQKAEEGKATMAGFRVRDLILKDGEEAVGWFVGSDDEPLEVPFHSVNLGKAGFRMMQCAHGFDDHDGCVGCYQHKKKKDKRVSKPSPQFVFNFADARFIHKRKNKEKTKEAGFDRFDFFPCESEDLKPNADECEHCKKQLSAERKLGDKSPWVRERQGLEKAKFSSTWASAIMGLNEKLQKKCECGGKTKIISYKNGDDEEVDDLEDVDDPADWRPVFECSKCDDPRPGSIRDRPIAIMRNGVGKQTSYTFTAKEKVPMPKWVKRIEPLDLEAVMVPMSADKQADLLGVENPFDEFEGGKSKKRKGKKGGKKGRDEDSEEYEEEDDDEQDEDDDPFKDDDDDEDEDE